MTRKIILSENDYDNIVLKINYVEAITDLLISDSMNSKWADETIANSLGVISMISHELSSLAKKVEVIA